VAAAVETQFAVKFGAVLALEATPAELADGDTDAVV